MILDNDVFFQLSYRVIMFISKKTCGRKLRRKLCQTLRSLLNNLKHVHFKFRKKIHFSYSPLVILKWFRFCDTQIGIIKQNGNQVNFRSLITALLVLQLHLQLTLSRQFCALQLLVYLPDSARPLEHFEDGNPVLLINIFTTWTFSKCFKNNFIEFQFSSVNGDIRYNRLTKHLQGILIDSYLLRL